MKDAKVAALLKPNIQGSENCEFYIEDTSNKSQIVLH